MDNQVVNKLMAVGWYHVVRTTCNKISDFINNHDNKLLQFVHKTGTRLANEPRIRLVTATCSKLVTRLLQRAQLAVFQKHTVYAVFKYI